MALFSVLWPAVYGQTATILAFERELDERRSVCTHHSSGFGCLRDSDEHDSPTCAGQRAIIVQRIGYTIRQ